MLVPKGATRPVEVDLSRSLNGVFTRNGMHTNLRAPEVAVLDDFWAQTMTWLSPRQSVFDIAAD